jgi:hypothetical protein
MLPNKSSRWGVAFLSFRTLAACAASLIALSTANAAEPLKTSALSLDTGGPMPAEQQALGFDHADLTFKILPDKKAIEGEATLTFTAKAPLDKLGPGLRPHLRDPQADHRWQGAEARRLEQSRGPDDHHPASQGGQG